MMIAWTWVVIMIRDGEKWMDLRCFRDGANIELGMGKGV